MNDAFLDVPTADTPTAPHRLMRKGWATQLFTTDLPQASTQLRKELDRTLEETLPPAERFRIMEVGRVLVMGLHNKWRRLYRKDGKAFFEDVALWQALWPHYSLGLRPLLDGEPGLQSQKAFFLQRALFVGKQLRLAHTLAQKPFPEKLWQEIHAYYRFSEILQCSNENIIDRLSSTDNRVSAYSTYVHTLLIDLANLSALSAQQILWMDRWLPRLARKTQMLSTAATSMPQVGLFLEIHLDGSRGGVLRARTKPSSELTRVVNLEELAKTLRRRRRHLITGETPARLKLGGDIDSDQATLLLAHLEAAWCPPDLSHVPEEASSFDDWNAP